MIQRFFSNAVYRKHRSKILMILDLCMVLLSYGISLWTKNDFQIVLSECMTINELIIGLVITLIIYAIVFYFLEIYKSLWKYIGIDEMMRLAASDGIATGIVMFISLLYFKDASLLSMELVAGILSLFLMAGLRVIYRLLRRHSANNSTIPAKNVVIIGAGDAGNLLLKEINQNNSFNYKIIGFLDDYKKDVMIGGYKVLGTTDDIKKIKEEYHVDEALIAISKVSQKDLRRIYDCCINSGLEAKIMNFKFRNNTKNDNLVANIKIEDLLGRGEIKLDQSEISSYLSDKVVAVTGAGGSIVSELCRQIVKFQPRKLIMIDIS